MDTLKRTRDEYTSHQDVDDDDDDVSLVSRSPSPAPMDVDPNDISKYDEHLRYYAPAEAITVDTRISSENKGFSLLAKLGWKEGMPLGFSPDARVDPIPFTMKQDGTGIGKISQDTRVIAETVSRGRELDSIRQHFETAEQRRLREEQVSRQSDLKTAISATLRAFYCELCDKQFQTVAQYDEHTNSYAHHHRARAKDMQANSRIKNQADVDKAKEKERKREEKELRKMAAAAGVKMPKPIASGAVATAQPGVTLAPVEPKPTGFKKSGWASVSTQAAPAPSRFAQPPPVATPPPPPPAPASMDATHQPPPPPAPIPSQPLVPPEPAQPSRSNWQQFQKKAHGRR